jgi:hypothetical protein
MAGSGRIFFGIGGRVIVGHSYFFFGDLTMSSVITPLRFFICSSISLPIKASFVIYSSHCNAPRRTVCGIIHGSGLQLILCLCILKVVNVIILIRYARFISQNFRYGDP